MRSEYKSTEHDERKKDFDEYEFSIDAQIVWIGLNRTDFYGWDGIAQYFFESAPLQRSHGRIQMSIVASASNSNVYKSAVA